MVKKLRSIWWLTQGLINRYHKIIFGSFAIGIFLFIFSLKIWPIIKQKLNRQEIVLGLVGSYTPTNLPSEIQQLISAGLTEIDTQGQAQPALAKKWQMDQNGKEYLFYLRDDIYWHDRKKFTAYDVNYNLKDVEFIPLSNDKLTE